MPASASTAVLGSSYAPSPTSPRASSPAAATPAPASVTFLGGGHAPPRPCSSAAAKIDGCMLIGLVS
uniref:Uncharacterized protein n=1 Tax=Oryza glumipatula TaxID=40148 RepID=A0A0E0ALA7_9ORYZ